MDGDLVKAVENFTKSLEIYRRIGDHIFITWTLLPPANMSFVNGDLDQATEFYEQSIGIMHEIGDLHGIGAVSLGLGLLAQSRGDSDESEQLLAEAQTKLREGGGGQGLSWPISNVLLDTSTSETLIATTDRYQASLSLPAAEWVRMVCSDGEEFRARMNAGS
jgi:hypothetical protein